MKLVLIILLFILGCIAILMLPYFDHLVTTLSPQTIWTIFLVISILLSWYTIYGMRKKRILYYGVGAGLHLATGQAAIAFGALYLTLGLGTIVLALLELFH